MRQKQNQQTNPRELALPQEYLHKLLSTEEILLREAGVRLCGLTIITHSSGRGRERDTDQQQTLGNLLFPSPPPPPSSPLRNQAGPGLRRTELCLLIRLLGRRGPQTTVLTCDVSCDASRLKRPLTTGKKRSQLDF